MLSAADFLKRIVHVIPTLRKITGLLVIAIVRRLVFPGGGQTLRTAFSNMDVFPGSVAMALTCQHLRWGNN
jgi:hypothetical protein